MNTISSILTAAASLSVEQQLALNKGLCEMIKRNRRVQAAVVGTQFVPGDVVRFNAKTRGIKHIVINGFNRAGTAVVVRFNATQMVSLCLVEFVGQYPTTSAQRLSKWKL